MTDSVNSAAVNPSNLSKTTLSFLRFPMLDWETIDDVFNLAAFPINSSDISALEYVSSKELLYKLNECLDRMAEDIECKYLPNRKEFCAISIQLNLRYASADVKVPAPAFRPSICTDSIYERDVMLAIYDMQVIDMHLLHCLGLRGGESSFAMKIFREDGFNFEHALDLAYTVNDLERMLELLNIDGDYIMQSQLSVLRGRGIRCDVYGVRSFVDTVLNSLFRTLKLEGKLLSGDEKLWEAIVTGALLCDLFGWERSAGSLNRAIRVCYGEANVEPAALKKMLEVAETHIDISISH